MRDEMDPELLRLFAASAAPPADDEFVKTVMAQIERTRRTRWLWQILSIAAFVIVVSLNMGPVLDKTAAAVRVIGDLSPLSADLFITPWGWTASMLIGAGVLLRFRPSRR